MHCIFPYIYIFFSLGSIYIGLYFSNLCILYLGFFIFSFIFLQPVQCPPYILGSMFPSNVASWILWFLVCLHPTINPAVGNYALNLDDMIQEGEAQQGILVGQCLYIEPKVKLIQYMQQYTYSSKCSKIFSHFQTEGK